MKNERIADLLQEMSDLLEIEGVLFKPRAYGRAADSVRLLDFEAEKIYKEGGIKALEKIPGVGRGIAEKIEEYLQTGKIKEREKLRHKIPVDVERLMQIEGVGPKAIRLFYKKLGVRDIDDLKRALKSGRIEKLERFGKKSADKLRKSVGFFEESHERFLIGDVLPIARAIKEKLGEVDGVSKIELGGSLRRWEETVGDIDILAVAGDPKRITDAFCSLDEVKAVLAKGGTKSSVRLRIGIDADLRVVKAESFGAALQYFTGNKAHNVKLRKVAISKNMKLNEYGLFKGRNTVAGKFEKDIYNALGVKYPPPELRSGSDELARDYAELVKTSDIKGDVQVHSDWTDGKYSIEEMALEARRLGYEYIAITDHTRGLTMTGLDEKKLLRYMREIDKVDKKISGIKILKGAELNIAKDGTLDIRDEILRKLDFAGAAVHSSFNLSEREQTQRIIRAMRNPHVDIIFHPTGRILQKRPAIKIDIKALLKEARRTGTMMEINANPYRLDLKDSHVRLGMEAGVMFMINTDAHAKTHLGFMGYGVHTARRGGVAQKRVVNSWSLGKLERILKKDKLKRWA